MKEGDGSETNTNSRSMQGSKSSEINEENDEIAEVNEQENENEQSSKSIDHKNIKLKNKKKTKLYSDAFPKKELGLKINHHSKIHDVIVYKNLQIALEDVYYRELKEEDIQELICLHKEWLPINYDETFFKKNMTDLGEREVYNLGACYLIDGIEYIVGSIFCEMKNEGLTREYAPFELCHRNLFENCCCQVIDLCYIMTIGVIDECRRIGLGSRLINEFNRRLLEHSPETKGVYLHVIDYNTGAIKFYEKNGFKEVNVIRNYYHIQDEVYHGRILFKEFDEKERKSLQAKDNRSGFLSKLFNFLIVSPISFVFCCSKKKKKKSD